MLSRTWDFPRIGMFQGLSELSAEPERLDALQVRLGVDQVVGARARHPRVLMQRGELASDGPLVVVPLDLVLAVLAGARSQSIPDKRRSQLLGDGLPLSLDHL